jgi:hypothetical protein
MIACLSILVNLHESWRLMTTGAPDSEKTIGQESLEIFGTQIFKGRSVCRRNLYLNHFKEADNES